MVGASHSQSFEPAPEIVRPEVFLFTPWRGHGVVCDAFGMPSDKYENSGRGRRDADGSVVLEHEARFESGVVNCFEWRLDPDAGESIRARDLKTGAELKGAMTAHGFQWEFPAMVRTPLGVRRCRVQVDYRILSPTEASSTSTVTLLGVTVGTASAHIRHLDPREVSEA